MISSEVGSLSRFRFTWLPTTAISLAVASLILSGILTLFGFADTAQEEDFSGFAVHESQHKRSVHFELYGFNGHGAGGQPHHPGSDGGRFRAFFVYIDESLLHHPADAGSGRRLDQV